MVDVWRQYLGVKKYRYIKFISSLFYWVSLGIFIYTSKAPINFK